MRSQVQALFQRFAVSADRRLVLVAPSNASVPADFAKPFRDSVVHERLVREAQRLRGVVYLDEGAISPGDVTRDGRYRTPEDVRAWHLLMMDGNRVTACMWYLHHHGLCTIEDLRVRDCPLATLPVWREKFLQAVASEIASARREGLQYVELGGWAVDPQYRHTGEGLVLALVAYALGRAFGGALGLTTATVRHASSTILRRLGGASLHAEDDELPSYFDDRYGCQMEVLRFDSRAPNVRYDAAIGLLAERLRQAPVIAVPFLADAQPFMSQPVASSTVTGGVAA
jgi:hypothetical protein